MINLKKKYNLFFGRYGAGKTNTALNFAVNEAKSGKKTAVVDLDIVNPYFRSTNFGAEFKKKYGIKTISPSDKTDTLDSPYLSPEIYSVFDSDYDAIIFDIGGDATGTLPVGQFSEKIIASCNYDAFFVVNKFRSVSGGTDEDLAVKSEIEAAGKIPMTKTINNSHLQESTTMETLLSSLTFAERFSRETNLPIFCTTCPESIFSEAENKIPYPYKVKRYIVPPWKTDIR